jgi:3',5'-cyclic AMP phosphodiesterase CpdA
MPIHLLPTDDDPTSRRAFLTRVVAGGAALSITFAKQGLGVGSSPWFAWMADTHIAADASAKSRGQVMAENLKAAIADVLAQADRPAGVLIDGDLALNDGQVGDYRTLIDLLAPLREAQLPIHLSLGNHEDRDHFREVLKTDALTAKDVSDKHVGLVDHGAMRLLLLDSLQRPNYTPGKLGEDQIAWLGRVLDSGPTKPTVLFVHHNLAADGSALTDHSALLALAQPRRQVKAIVYGHTHRWEREDREGLHLLNLPAVAYPFANDQPLGWVRAQANAEGLVLRLHCVGGDRKKDREQITLKWRS